MNKRSRQEVPKSFNNLSPTPQFGEGYGMFDAVKTMFNRPKTLKPAQEIAAVKTDLKTYYSKTPSIIWFGHSS